MGGALVDESSSLTGDNGLSPLEAMLKSPLLRQSGIGGKGSAKAMDMLEKVLALRRQMKRVWRHLKPWLPLLFWLALLLPLILTFKQRLLALSPWKWLDQYIWADRLRGTST